MPILQNVAFPEAGHPAALLELVQNELASRGRTTALPGVVLLTDGEPSGATPDEVRGEAGRARAAGLLVFTIGLGGAVDQPLLRDVATNPAWYFAAPDTRDLAAIYGQIAYELPCRPMWP